MSAAWTLRRSRNSCAAAISGSWKSFVTVNCAANASNALAFQSRSPQPALSLRWIGNAGVQRLPGAAQVHRQAQQPDAQDRSAEANAGGHREAVGSHAQQPGSRV